MCNNVRTLAQQRGKRVRTLLDVLSFAFVAILKLSSICLNSRVQWQGLHHWYVGAAIDCAESEAHRERGGDFQGR